MNYESNSRFDGKGVMVVSGDLFVKVVFSLVYADGTI